MSQGQANKQSRKKKHTLEEVGDTDASTRTNTIVNRFNTFVTQRNTAITMVNTLITIASITIALRGIRMGKSIKSHMQNHQNSAE